MVQSAISRTALATADSTLLHGRLLNHFEEEIDRAIGPNTFQSIIIGPSSIAEKTETDRDMLDVDDDAVISFRTIRLAVFHFLLYAFPQESIASIRRQLPSYAQINDSASFLVTEFLRVVGKRSGVQIDVDGAWCVETGAIIAVTQLLPVFFHTLAEMGSDEALITTGTDKASETEGDPIYQPRFWNTKDVAIWNERWCSLADDARFIVVMSRALADVPKKRAEYAALMLMRLATARESLNLNEFEQIAKIVAEEAGDTVISLGKLN